MGVDGEEEVPAVSVEGAEGGRRKYVNPTKWALTPVTVVKVDEKVREEALRLAEEEEEEKKKKKAGRVKMTQWALTSKSRETVISAGRQPSVEKDDVSDEAPQRDAATLQPKKTSSFKAVLSSMTRDP